MENNEIRTERLAIATESDIVNLLRDDLLAIERELGRHTASSVDVVTEIAEYLYGAGGKRLRPILLLLTARGLGYRDADAIHLGTVVELVHTATLIHDDIIDRADIRRGRPSTNTIWGNEQCVLAGDWLYMQAFRVALEKRNLHVLDLLISLTQQMVEGELLQIKRLGIITTEAEYYDLIFRKTACLFSTSMRLGAAVASAPPSTEEMLASYGRDIGLAFQIIDDVLDFTASEEVLGKPVGNDICEGKATLPIIYAFQHGTDAERRTIQTILMDRGFDHVSREDLIQILHHSGSIEYAVTAALRHAGQANCALAALPDSDFKRALAWIPGFVVTRER